MRLNVSIWNQGCDQQDFLNTLPDADVALVYPSREAGELTMLMSVLEGRVIAEDKLTDTEMLVDVSVPVIFVGDLPEAYLTPSLPQRTVFLGKLFDPRTDLVKEPVFYHCPCPGISPVFKLTILIGKKSHGQAEFRNCPGDWECKCSPFPGARGCGSPRKQSFPSRF